MRRRAIGTVIAVFILAGLAQAQDCNNGQCFAQVNLDSITMYLGSGDSLSGTVPANTTDQLVFAFVTARFIGFDPPAEINTPAGWEMVMSGPANSAIGFGPYPFIVGAVYLKRGTGTTPNVSWTFNRSADISRVVFGVLDYIKLTNWESGSRTYITNVAGVNMISIPSVYTYVPNCLVMIFSAATFDSNMQSSDWPGVISSVQASSEIAIWAGVQNVAGYTWPTRVWFMSGSGTNGPTAHTLVVIRPR